MTLANYNPDCLRRVANWTKLAPEHKFDKSKFSPDAVTKDMEAMSPKMVALLQNIKDLDAKDMKEHGTTFKHFIFSDVKQGGYGSKIISSSLIAAGFTLGYKAQGGRIKLKDDDELLKTKHENFFLLCSTGVFDDTINVKLKKQILDKFNERPTNIYGKHARFIVMDSGFKEGIDLFDVKYVHIFEPQTSKADQKQVIGRGTRTCGQRGLQFHPTRGWPLHVFVYDVAISQELKDKFEGQETLFKSYMSSKGFDVRQITFADDLEKYAIIGSVDYELNKNIHSFEIEDDDYYYQDIFKGGAKRKTQEKQEVLCDKNCGKVRPTKHVPVRNGMFATVMLVLGKDYKPSSKTMKPREYFCTFLKSDGVFCSHVKQIHDDPVTYIKTYEKDLVASIKKKQHLTIPPYVRAAALRFIFGIIPKPKNVKLFTEKEAQQVLKKMPSPPPAPPPSPKSATPESASSSLSTKTPTPVAASPSPEDIILSPRPPVTPVSFLSIRNHIREYFMQYAWPKVKLENMCGPPPSPSTSVGGTNIMKLTPTQDFIRTYFIPQNPVKGMLLHHSVGTGKTCAAIATASSSFEKEGYTILWVTRTTLKSDIWKNMFDQVCSTVIQERLKDGLEMPATMENRMQLLSKAWSIRPMSYKQFSNLVSGNNAMYQALVKKNGKEDPLRKTLLIIDEAHKLYGGTDLSSVERPNMNKLHAAIMKSYNVSGDESVRLILMTATPFTNDPMEMVKLLNLCKPYEHQFPITYEEFSRSYLTPWGTFSRKGSRKFLDAIAGHVSYLNRERDARQFAQPRIIPVLANMTYPTNQETVEDIKEKYTAEIQHLRDGMKDTKTAASQKKKSLREEMLAKKKELKERCKGLKKENRQQCLAQVEQEIHALNDAYAKAVDNMVDNTTDIKERISALRKEQKEKVDAIENDPTQFSIITQKCLVASKNKSKVPASSARSSTP